MKRPTLDDCQMKAALPDTSSDLSLSELEDTVTVFRDSFGVPHVRANTVHDAFLGQGFATSQDRLWQMEYDRRRAYGRWAEYVGTGGINQDVMMRKFCLHASVRRDYGALNGETRAMLDAFAAGVNAFIHSTTSLPIEYKLVDAEPEIWEPWDCIAVFKVRHLMMGLFESKLWRARLVNALGAERVAQIVPGQQGRLLIAPPGVYDDTDMPTAAALQQLQAGADLVNWLGADESGSNNWAVSGSRTASGTPLLAGDPHRPLEVPNVYYQNHISCPEFDGIGLSFPGVPGFPHFGHVAQVAWSVTHAQADYQDLYVERFKPNSGMFYEYKGQWLDAKVEHEVVRVRGAAPVQIDVISTHHGPIVAGDPTSGTAIAFKYTGTDGVNSSLQCLPRMLRSSSVDDMDEAMRDWVDPSNNFVFADVHGSIGYLNRGRLPVRSMTNAWLPVPGWDGEHEWNGFVPFDQLTRVRDPAGGLIVTANNQIARGDGSHYISLQFSPAHRATRIKDRLEEYTAVTVQDMASIHADIVSIPARQFSRLLSEAKCIDESVRAARRLLENWDGSMDRDTVAPTIYSTFRLEVDRYILGCLLGSFAEEALTASGRGAALHVSQLRAQIAAMAADGDTSLLPDGANWSTLVSDSLARAVNRLEDRLGSDMSTWTWGRVHFTQPKHTLSEVIPTLAVRLNPPSVQMSGDGDTPQSGGYSPGEPFTMTGMSVARYAFDLSDWDNSGWITPLGSSGHPASPHYIDQAPIWADVKLVPMLYSWDKIAIDAKDTQVLSKE